MELAGVQTECESSLSSDPMRKLMGSRNIQEDDDDAEKLRQFAHSGWGPVEKAVKGLWTFDVTGELDVGGTEGGDVQLFKGKTGERHAVNEDVGLGEDDDDDTTLYWHTLRPSCLGLYDDSGPHPKLLSLLAAFRGAALPANHYILP
ncbi:hypothetical protein D9757_013524 [Collybiopsis confluens]|uniref:Uncharacterized protein n=1 Tax=Collybiopsis confluens TaxID=2823264 RepID=A0A8H5LGM7_9AGAR|nr:hypothetical protein D9757_013524 [Collybiopsis confluens]